MWPGVGVNLGWRLPRISGEGQEDREAEDGEEVVEEIPPQEKGVRSRGWEQGGRRGGGGGGKGGEEGGGGGEEGEACVGGGDVGSSEQVGTVSSGWTIGQGERVVRRAG